MFRFRRFHGWVARLVLAVVLAVSSLGAAAQEVPLDLRVVMSGHSLTDPVHDPLEAMIRAAGGPRGTVELSTIPGSPMEWRWNNAPRLDLRARMAEFDLLVLTERVALSNTVRYHDSMGFARRFAELAWAAGADVILYASWVSLESGPEFAGRGSDVDQGLPWRERLDRELRVWEEIRASVNAERPAGVAEMRLIPAISVMAALYDEIEAGRAPVADISALFRDAIHPSELGAWLVALTHYAVIFGSDPSGLTRPEGVSAAQAAWYEALVWRVVSGHAGSGI
ncbi:hypothetical protein [Pararhodobacter oceanensis]|uniref:hypothetical protein n=1 Tax=Pararhodobacter oceanensis TaxID=2172121 RepID=UPI003A900E4F